MRVVSVAGYRDTGKTTLIERLIPALAQDGRVGTVKSIHHDVDIDATGKDTHRHRMAGADTVVGVTPSTTFQIEARGKTDGVTVEEILDSLDPDIYSYVVVEGFKEADIPSILVGDIEPEAVGGPAITRVKNPKEADIEALHRQIRSVEDWQQ